MLAKLRYYFCCTLLLVLPVLQTQAQKQGQAVIDSLKQGLSKAKNDTNKVTAINTLAMEYAVINPDSGIKYAASALSLSSKLKWDKGMGDAYNIIGINYGYKSDYETAINYFEKAKQAFEKAGNKRGLLKIIGNVGILYEYRGNYSRALENYFQALKYAEELDDKLSIAINLGNIGSVYDYLFNYPKALEYYFKAIKICREQHRDVEMATYLGNVGNVYAQQKQYDEALTYQKNALELHETLGVTDGVARDMSNIAFVYVSKKNYPEALVYCFKSLELSKKAGYKALESKALEIIGEALLMMAKNTANRRHTPAFRQLLHSKKIPSHQKGMLEAAVDYLNKSILLNLEMTNLDDLMHSYQYLSEAQYLLGRYKDAVISSNKYAALKDSVLSLESKVKITNLETKREMDLKNKEIELRNKQIELNKLEIAKKRNERVFFIAGILLLLVVVMIVYRNMRLENARELSENKLSAFQARMNPHFIFNSFNSIQSLMLNNEVMPSVRYLSEFSKLMRQILDNSAKNKIMLAEEIQMLRSYIVLEQLRYNNFKWEIHIAADVSEETCIPGMIVQPFVENAIVHGFQPDQKDYQLNISFERGEGQIICTVDDNGIGREKAFELNREHDRDRQSHGTTIVANRLTLLGNKRKGLINRVIYTDKMVNGMATGTQVVIQIPVL